APEIRPRTVIYDVELSLDLPLELSVTSGANAMAHAVEALYAPGTNPVMQTQALDALRRMAAALRRIAAQPSDVEAREEALVAAWLAGRCLDAGGMGLHHKLCHILGGSFRLPHAPTHAVVLPHVMAYNAAALPPTVAAALDGRDAPAAMYDLI